jgi:basic membrane protein A and related proteins
VAQSWPHGRLFTAGPAEREIGTVSRTFRLVFMALFAALVLGAAACGDDDDDGGGGGGGGGGDAEKPAIKAGVVTDIGGLNDRGFNELANTGRKRAQSDLGIETRVLISDSNGDYVPNLSTLAQQQFDIIVSNGFLMGEATNTVATKFPNANFAIIDFPVAEMKDKPKNATGLLFAEQEGGYLAGYLAGLWAKDNNAKAVSTVGGQKLPPVDRFIAGFQAGAKKAYPGIETLNGYSQDFEDQAKCKEIALDQIANGSKVVFQVAGGCGLGALDAAKEKGVQGIGVDKDQGFLGPHVMTSVVKKVDVAVFDAIKATQDGTIKGDTDTVANVENGGVGLGKFNTEGQKYADQIKKIQDQIASGEIKNIPDTVK